MAKKRGALKKEKLKSKIKKFGQKMSGLINKQNNKLTKVSKEDDKSLKPNKSIKNDKEKKKIKSTNAIKFNALHKRFVAYFEGEDMRVIWRKVRKMYEQENGVALPKRFVKVPGSWESLNEWYNQKVLKRIETGWVEKSFYNKQDLKEQGWDEKIIKVLYPKPDRIMYLGRGRRAYYYNADLVHEMQDSEEFIEYIALKEERKRKREERAKRRENPLNVGFGSEFIR